MTLPVAVALLPVAFGFARHGSERLDRGASMALGLVWVGTACWLALLVILVGWQNGGGISRKELPGIELLPVGWVVCWGSLAVARCPSPRALIPAIPAGVVVGAWLVNQALAPNPAISPPGTIPHLIDLAGDRKRQLGSPVPPCCIGLMDGTTIGDCMATFRTKVSGGQIIPTRVPPDLPLTEARAWTSWVVVRTDALFPSALRFRHLDVGSARGSAHVHLVQYLDRDGLAVVLLDGRPAVNGGAPTPLGPEIATQVKAALRKARSPNRGGVRVEVDPSARWTVQDMVSMCATGNTDGSGVECGFSTGMGGSTVGP